MNATWTALPLRQAVDRLAAVAALPVVIDRRIDPGLPISRDMRDEPLADALAAVAAVANGEVASLRSSIRIVPAGTAPRVEQAEAARERRIATLPAATRRQLSERRPLEWADGGRPRDIVATTAAAGGASLTGLDTVPHDHFAAIALPPLSLAERLDLVLAHFDLRVDWKAADGGRPRGTIVPLAEALAADASSARPGRARPRPAPEPPSPAAIKPAATDPAAAQPTFSLRVEAPLEQVLAAIAGRLGLEVVLDHGSLQARGISAGEIVRAEVSDASRDALLDAVLAPLALRWSIDEKTLRVSAPAPDAPRPAVP